MADFKLMHWNAIPLLVCVAGLLGTAGCGESKQCEKTRLSLWRKWQAVQVAAAERKNAGVDDQKWATVENKADLLQSAFATSQITWNSAEKAKGEIEAALQGISTDVPVRLEMFSASVKEAATEQDKYVKECR